MGAKLLASIIYLISPEKAPYFVFSLYTLVALSTCVYTSTLDDMDDVGTFEFSYKSISHSLGAAGRLIYSDSRIMFIIPYQISFGFTAALIAFYIMGTVISKSDVLGKQYVGLLSALIVLSGSLVSFPISKIANEYGKNIVMSFGCICLILVGLLFHIFSDDELGTWILIIPFLIIFGIGRGIWVSSMHLFIEFPKYKYIPA